MQKLDPAGISAGQIKKLDELYGHRGPIASTDTLIEIQRQAAQQEVIEFIKSNFWDAALLIAISVLFNSRSEFRGTPKCHLKNLAKTIL